MNKANAVPAGEKKGKEDMDDMGGQIILPQYENLTWELIRTPTSDLGEGMEEKLRR